MSCPTRKNMLGRHTAQIYRPSTYKRIKKILKYFGGKKKLPTFASANERHIPSLLPGVFPEG